MADTAVPDGQRPARDDRPQGIVPRGRPPERTGRRLPPRTAKVAVTGLSSTTGPPRPPVGFTGPPPVVGLALTAVGEGAATTLGHAAPLVRPCGLIGVPPHGLAGRRVRGLAGRLPPSCRVTATGLPRDTVGGTGDARPSPPPRGVGLADTPGVGTAARLETMGLAVTTRTPGTRPPMGRPERTGRPDALHTTLGLGLVANSHLRPPRKKPRRDGVKKFPSHPKLSFLTEKQSSTIYYLL